MGADYVIELECRPKALLTTQGIVARLKARSQAEAVLQMAREAGDRRPPSEIKFTTVLMRPEGRTQAEVSVQALFDQAAELDAQKDACQTCPARPDAAPFGCKGYLNYPIEVATEEWLMGRLPSSLDGVAGTMLKKAVQDFGWDGSYGARLRAQGDTFFVGREPIVRKWGGFFSRFALSSNQIWQMMFGVGPLQPAHAAMMCMFLGFPSHDDFLVDQPRDKALAAIHAAAQRCTSADLPPQVASMARFVAAMALAANLGTELFIDG